MPTPLTPQESTVVQQCINADCGATYPVKSVLASCPACGSMLDVIYSWKRGAEGPWPDFRASPGGDSADPLDASGVWRFRSLLPFFDDPSQIVTIGEGRTLLQNSEPLARVIGLDPGAGGVLHLQYEGLNPSGSFKDNGMAAAFTHARMVGATRVACASTGNTSASLAIYASRLAVRCFVFIGEGKIAYGKLSQALEYGATTLQVAGDFDACLARVLHIAERVPAAGLYLMNSVNPFRLEGQKTIMYRVLEALGVGASGRMPDWIVVPGGNLGNCSAFGKAFIELKALGLIDRIPRLAVIQSAGARTLDRVHNELGVRWEPTSPLLGRYNRAVVEGEYARMDSAGERAHTVATAIEINRPVNLAKALRALDAMNGVVRSVSDCDILEHKALVGRHGLGCEPASGASVAGASALIREGVIKPTESVVCILTGHLLKDPDATVAYHTGADVKAAAIDLSATRPTGRISNPPIRVADDLVEILKAMGLEPISRGLIPSR